MSTEVHISFQISIFIFLGNTQEWNYWIIWKFYFQFLEEPPTIFHSNCTDLHFCTQCMGVPFLRVLTDIFCRFDHSCSNRCEVVAHCSFDLHLSDNS